MGVNLLKSNKHINYLYKKVKSNLIGFKDKIEIHFKTRNKKGAGDDDLYYQINNWRSFSEKVRKKNKPLLLKLNSYPQSILIAGCQRSGTTMLSRIITQSEGMVNFWTELDDELDAALILSGIRPYQSDGRHCFQTTYVNECVNEYYDLLHGDMGHKLIWVLRNPYSVVYSMLYNWEDFALNELFQFCGVQAINNMNQSASGNRRRISRLEKACFSYNAKTSQVFALKEGIKTNRLMIIDYENLVKNRSAILPEVYQFINLPYQNEYADQISDTKLFKHKTLSARERDAIEKICMPVYQQTQRITDHS